MSRFSASQRLLALPAILLALVAATVAVFPFTHPETDFWTNLLVYVQTGHIVSTFLPGMYPFLAGFLFLKGGTAAIVALQALLYLGVAAVLFLTLRTATGRPRAAALAAFAISLDPDLLSSIPKLWDTEISVLFVSTIAYLCFQLGNRSYRPAVVLGMVWGLSLSVRPNLALMAFPIAYAIKLFRKEHGLRTAAIVAGLAFAVLGGTNTLVHGSFYLPQNGPYNFFAGANPHTIAALLDGLNAEPSIVAALADHGIYASDLYSVGLNPSYTRFGLQFLAAHPFEWLWFALVKLATLLRPDTKAHSLLSGLGLLKLLTALATPLWLALLILVRRWQRADKLMVALVAAYVLPFLLTNADPRFRVPLDVLVLTHSAMLAVAWRARSTSTAPAVIT